MILSQELCVTFEANTLWNETGGKNILAETAGSTARNELHAKQSRSMPVFPMDGTRTGDMAIMG